ncbi:MAG: VOC family protein [Spirochaeta sp.]|nr:VOC family protein [Spirochaeta sp.]
MSAAVSVIGVEHTGVMVPDPPALARWYRETLGAVEISRSTDDPPVMFLSFGGGALLELIPAKGDADRDHVHLCLSVDNMDAAVGALAAHGVALEKPVFTAYEGSAVAFFRDPAGNLLQLVQRVPNSGIHAEVYGS